MKKVAIFAANDDNIETTVGSVEYKCNKWAETQGNRIHILDVIPNLFVTPMGGCRYTLTVLYETT